MARRVTKQPSESRLFDIDCTKAVRTGATITNVISFTADVSGLTFGTPTISGTTIQVLISGGTSGQAYKVTVKFSTATDPVLEDEFWVSVIDL